MPIGKRSRTRIASTADSQQMTALLRLRELLLRGEFRPGERMAEIPVAERLGVSRTPLRLALTALEHEGLLEMHPTRGFIVRAFTRQDIQDAIEIRGLLEGMAGRRIVLRLPEDRPGIDAMLRPLKECLRDFDTSASALGGDTAESFELYIASNIQFHALLLGLAASSMLTLEMERISGLPFAAPGSGFVRTQADIPKSREILRIGQRQHHDIVEALEERDAVRAENLLREHSRLARQNLDIVLASPEAGRNFPGRCLIRDP